MSKAQQLKLIKYAEVDEVQDVCFCCHEQATHDVQAKEGWGLRMDLCDTCAGARWTRIKGEYALDCPAHGVLHALEIVNVGSAQIRRSRGEHTVLVCECTIQEAT